jgi:hypothetical protein
MNYRKRAKQLAIEILVGIALAVAVLVCAHLNLRYTGPSWKWIFFPVYTLVIFGAPIHKMRDALRMWLFWATLSALLLTHIVIFLTAFETIHNRYLDYYGLLAPIEAYVVLFIMRSSLQGRVEVQNR